MSIELDDVGSGYNLSILNSNFQKIEDAINGVSEDTVDIVLQSHLDANSNRIVNLSNAVDGNDAINYFQVQQLIEAITGPEDTQIFVYDTASELGESFLEAGSVAETKGRLSVGDGMSYRYIVYSTVDDVRAYDVVLGNGNIAVFDGLLSYNDIY